MKAIFKVDAAPGYEQAVEDGVAGLEGVFAVVREKDGNFDLAVAVEGDDEDRIRAIERKLRLHMGVQGVELSTSPGQDLLDRLRPG